MTAYETRAKVIDTDSGHECTIFPANADQTDLVTTWITAEGAAFLSLEDAR